MRGSELAADKARRELQHESVKAQVEGDVNAELAASAGRATPGVQPLFAGRDEAITLHARCDPASADRLSDLCVAYRGASGG
ncbi:MAG TPA: hypothetical protein VF570_19015 [Pyrinomonadaceae bacterium]